MHLYLVWFIAFVVVAPLIVSVHRYVSSSLRSVPGPFLARFTDAWYVWHVRKGRFEEENRALHEKYGRVIRYGPNRYSINDPEAAKIIYGHGTQFAKSSWYSSWGNPGQWTIFSDQNIKHHAQTRRLFQNAYTMTALVTYEPHVDECADLFTQRLTELAHGALPINMGHWFQCYAFDVIGMITYSKRLGFLDRGDDIGGVIAALEDHLSYATLAGIYSSLHPYLFPIRNYLAGEKGAGRAYVLNFTRQRIAEHQSAPKVLVEDDSDGQHTNATTDFLTKFFAKHTKDPETFTAHHIITGCAANMVAGSDTTAISLSAILYYLLKHPQSFQKLRSEIDEYQTQGKVSTHITFKESQALPYLQAVIKEVLRMHPATGLPLERVVPEGGATICGRFFPQGSIVGINSWVEHRNKLIFGDDADQFRPERWLIDDAEKLAFMNRHWMPFGLGSRTCIGRHISHLEISKLIPLLIRDFDFVLCGDLADPKVSWSTTNSWFVKPRDFILRVKLRSKQSTE